MMSKKLRGITILAACLTVFSVAQPALAGWFGSDEPNHEGAAYGGFGYVVGGIVGFCVGGPLGAAAGAALGGAGGYTYGEASDNDRRIMEFSAMTPMPESVK